MEKARFDVQQPAVQIKSYNGKSYVYIALHEEQGTEHTEMGDYHYYEYDFHEFCEKITNLNIDDVRAHPEKYLKYEPKREPTAHERIAALENQNQMLTDCVLEMSMLLYQ